MKTVSLVRLGLFKVGFAGLCVATLAAACSSGGGSGNPGTAGENGGAGTTGTAGQQQTTGHGGTTGAAGQQGSGQGGSTGVAGSGHGGTTGAAGSQSSTGEGGSSGPAGASGTGKGGTTGTAGGSGGTGTGKGGTTGTAGGSGGSTTSGTGGSAPAALTLITSASGAYWKTGTPTETTSGTANVTINDSSAQQNWDGWGGAFNENGWNVLTSSAMQTDAMNLLFGTDGAHFGWGRIPMGASDYAMSRYTLDDTGTDVTPNSGESNRPAADTSLAMFSLSRDGQKLIPYIKAAQAVNKDLKFWASPWTPPVWMKTGYKTDAAGSGTAKKASYFDGGNMKSDAALLTAYAQYYVKFVQGYKDMGINIDTVSPQNEPGYDQNYPSCLWDKTTYTSWIKTYLGPAMKNLNVRVMLGTLSNAGDFNRNDLDISSAVLADSTAKGFLSMVGAQWGVLGKVNGGQSFSGLPVWATEHRCGNYPWNPSMGCGEDNDPCPAYNMSQAPNDQAYGVESWKYIRNAINKGKVTAYNAWNMVLDKNGLGNDTSRDWRQDALVIAGGGSCAGNTTSSGLCATPAYYVFRHMSQFVAASGAKVVSTSGGDAVGFKNPDGSVVAAMYNSGSANANYVVSIKGKKYQFAMPSNGWATLVVP